MLSSASVTRLVGGQSSYSGRSIVASPGESSVQSSWPSGVEASGTPPSDAVALREADPAVARIDEELTTPAA